MSPEDAVSLVREAEWFEEDVLESEGGEPLTRSGLAEVVRVPFEDLPEEEAAALEPGFSTQPDTVSRSLRAWLGGDTFEDQRVVLRLRRAPRATDDMPPAYRMAVRELSGADSSVLDARAEAAEALVGRRDEALAEWRADVPRGVRSWEPLGSVIPLLLVEAPRDVVQQLIVADRRVAGAEMYVDTQEEPEDGSRISNASSTAIDGKEVASVIQTQQFYDAGFKGAGFAVVSEPGGDHIHVEHPGFLDDATGPRRALNCTGLPSATCSDWMDDETLTTTYDEHATAVASTLGGDVTENQDGILSGDQAERSSGVARDAAIWGISGYGSSIHTLIGSEDIVAVNRSAGGAISCGSYSSGAFDVDAVYEMGVAFVKSAGNNNNDTGQPYAWEADCNVSSAGEASGAFVVGAYNLDAAIPADDPGTSAREDIPTGEGRLYDGSGYGGDAVDGYTRTLVDITAPALEQNTYPHYQ